MADYILSAKVTLDTSQFSSNARQVQGQLNNMTNATGNMTKSVALGNIASGLFSKGMGMISSSIGQAIRRIDTMKNFPIVMESLGYNADDAAKSIQKISDNLDGLPTSTDSIVATVQRLAPLTKSLDEATDIALAMNNALLAGGRDAGVQANALGQYQRMLSAGAVDMRGWRSLMNAMPGQLDQVAKSMLGQKAKAQDLFAAMKAGEITFTDFNNEVVKLNQKGLPGMKNFEEQARAATGGIGTAVENLRNRIAKGLADILEGIGRERISGFINNLSSSIKTGLSGLSDFAGKAADVIFPILEKIVKNLPKIAAAVTAITGLKFAGNIVGQLSAFGANILNVEGNVGKLKAGFNNLKMAGVGVAGALAGIAAALAVKAIVDYVDHIRDMAAATDGLRAAARGATEDTKSFFDTIFGDGEGVAGADGGKMAKAVDELAESGARMAQKWREQNTEVEASGAAMDAYMKTIEQLSGKQGETEKDTARLQTAVDGLNEALGTDYTVVYDGGYKVMAGDAEVATEEIRKLIEVQKAQLRLEAYKEMYKDAVAYEKQTKEAEEAAKKAYDETVALYGEHPTTEEGIKQVGRAEQAWKDAAAEASSASAAVAELDNEITNATIATDKANGEFNRFVESNSELKNALLDNGVDLADFSQKLEESGIKVEDLGKLTPNALRIMGESFDGSTDSIKRSYAALHAADTGVRKVVSSIGKIKPANVEVSASGADETKNKLDDTADAAKGIPGSKNVNVTANTGKAETMLSRVASYIKYISGSHSFSLSGIVKAINGGKQAAGGVFLGNPNIIPRHADGGILAQPTLTSVGWVGEAGAEAIIPLSNKTYIKPFAQTVAAEMGGMNYGDVYVTLAYNADSNAKQMASDLSREIKMRRALEVF